MKQAVHILYRSDFKDPSLWDFILEAHGIEQSEEDGIQYDEITIRATVEAVSRDCDVDVDLKNWNRVKTLGADLGLEGFK